MSPKEEAAAAAAADADGQKSELDRDEIASMKKMLLETKVDGGKKSVWAMTLETFGMADGKHKKDDIQLESLTDGLELLNAYVEEKELHHSEHGSKGKDKHESAPPEKLMDLVPLAEFNATQDQFLTGFLKWAETKENNNSSGDKEKPKKFNVSKACRRLDAYFEWMHDNRDSFEEPLTLESIKPAAELWGIQVTYDNQGHFIWWVDLGSLDKDAVKKMPPREHLRFVVWFSHLVMLDENAQNNGAYIVEDMAMMGFFKMATLVPPEVGAKMDRLTIGILPVRVKQIYIFGAARWMSLLMSLMKPFMGKKMRQRMVVLPRKTNMQTFCDDLVTRANIPVDWCGLQGEAPRDAIMERFEKK